MQRKQVSEREKQEKEKQEKAEFLKAFEESLSVVDAVRALGWVIPRVKLYIRNDPEFADAMIAIRTKVVDEIQEKAIELGKRGDPLAAEIFAIGRKDVKRMKGKQLRALRDECRRVLGKA